MNRPLPRILLALLLLLRAAGADAQVTLTQGTNFGVDVAKDGRLAMDLLGGIWILPAAGGEAAPVMPAGSGAHRPRWSPDAGAIVYQRRSEGQERLWLYRFKDRSATQISNGRDFDQHPAWHPDGERIVLSSDRRDTGFDLWEIDLATRLSWRVSSLPGDETEPTWSADGRHLAYIHYEEGYWSLMLRRHGQPDQVLERSAVRLSSPAWRPDGSLITFLRHGADGFSIDMAILSEPLLLRPLIRDEDFFIAPVAWRGRQQMLYASNGAIRTRSFNAWTSRNLPFRATVRWQETRKSVRPAPRDLPRVNEPSGELVLRAARLFDGVSRVYRESVDIIIDGGRVKAIEKQRERPGKILVDVGDLTALPGFIDGRARLPAVTANELGPALLAFGITTVVSDNQDAARLNDLWSGKSMPGPRVLGRDWAPGLEPLTSALLGPTSLPVSPAGIRYENGRISADSEPAAFLSALADARTRGLSDLLECRQARLVDHLPAEIRRYVDQPTLDVRAPPIVLASEPNGLPPGIALHGELLALEEAGLEPFEALRAAGINAAGALGLGLKIGRVAPGAAADLVIVDGDPLAGVKDAVRVVAVVRNGRFFSAIGLIELAEQAAKRRIN